MTVWGHNRVAALKYLMQHIGIISNQYYDFREGYDVKPTTWWVVDHSTSDDSVGYPGDMVAECSSYEEADNERAKYILHEVDRTVNLIENCTFHNTTLGYAIR